MAIENYNLLCDDFYMDMYVNTELELPTARDTILTFFERMQKQFPSMGNFYRRDNNYYLEEDSSTGRYRWIVLEKDRIGSGVVNPAAPEDAYRQDRLVLELIPYMLGVGHLDIDSLDVSYGLDFDYIGSHDEVIAEALLGGSAFSGLLDLPSCRPIDLSPSMVVALSGDNRLQARISIESRTSIFEPGEKDQPTDRAISLFFTIRQFRSPNGKFDVMKSFENQCRVGEELMAEKIVPLFVRPLMNVIAQKRFI
jgi:hypothetical protein